MASVTSEESPGSDITVDWSTPEEAIEHAIQDDPDLKEIASRLDSDVKIDPDRDLNIETNSDNSDSMNKDSDSVSTTSSTKDIDEGIVEDESPKLKKKINDETPSSRKSSITINGELKEIRKSSIDSTGKSLSVKSKSSNGKEMKSSSKNPLKILKKLTKFDKPSKKSETQADFSSEFAAVVVDRLPQVFVAKYLGSRKVSGLCGLHHVRRPVDELVKEVQGKMEGKSQIELPLLYVVISPKGLDLREHKQNKVKDVAPLGLMPIDFISYGVQDIKYWRVFTAIVVSELSARSRTATCHAFLCDNTHNGRKMALALGAAFNVYAKNLKAAGKAHNFQVELRPPDQLADAVDAECDV